MSDMVVQGGLEEDLRRKCFASNVEFLDKD